MTIRFYCSECDVTYETAYSSMDGTYICVVCSAEVEQIDDEDPESLLADLELDLDLE